MYSSLQRRNENIDVGKKKSLGYHTKTPTPGVPTNADED
jgi:hypothetical protein